MRTLVVSALLATACPSTATPVDPPRSLPPTVTRAADIEDDGFTRRRNSTRDGPLPRDPFADARAQMWNRERALAMLAAAEKADADAYRAEREWLEIQVWCAAGDASQAKQLAERRTSEHRRRCNAAQSCTNPFARSLPTREALLGAPQQACELDALQRLDAAFVEDPWPDRMSHACEVDLRLADKLRRLRGVATVACAELCIDPPPPTVRLPTQMQCVDVSLHAQLQPVSTAALPSRARQGSIATPFELDVVRTHRGDLAAGTRIRVWHPGGSKDGVTETFDFFADCGADVESLASRRGPFALCVLPAGDGWVAICNEASWAKKHAHDVRWWKTFCAAIPVQPAK